MAMLNVQKNLASEMQSVALSLLELKNRMSVISAMYSAESMATLADDDYEALTELAHVTVVEMTAAKQAIDAINASLGDYSAGTNAYKLMRIVNVIPS